MQTFFCDGDFYYYMELTDKFYPKYGIENLSFCLMPNHVHHVLIPHYKDSFARGLGEIHKRYSAMINKRMNWSGFLWQSRFYSDPLLDDERVENAHRYVELNPVRARLVERPEDYKWSSAYMNPRSTDFYAQEYDIQSFRQRSVKGKIPLLPQHLVDKKDVSLESNAVDEKDVSPS